VLIDIRLLLRDGMSVDGFASRIEDIARANLKRID